MVCNNRLNMKIIVKHCTSAINIREFKERLAFWFHVDHISDWTKRNAKRFNFLFCCSQCKLTNVYDFRRSCLIPLRLKYLSDYKIKLRFSCQLLTSLKHCVINNGLINNGLKGYLFVFHSAHVVGVYTLKKIQKILYPNVYTSII